jgi:Ca2+-binding RTX toxin-like protein
MESISASLQSRARPSARSARHAPQAPNVPDPKTVPLPNSDWLLGEDGGDFLSGGAWNDTLFGGVGGDGLYDGDDADRLHGEDGGDFLFGGDGGDQLSGMSGRDSFEFRRGYDTDTILDFKDDADTIELRSSLGVTSRAEALSHAGVVNGDTVFTFDTGDVLIVKNIADPNLLRDDIVIA